VLVQDNLNTHKPASLYEAFPAAEARRLVERFGFAPHFESLIGWRFLAGIRTCSPEATPSVSRKAMVATPDG
jgi:hypothetical protein